MNKLPLTAVIVTDEGVEGGSIPATGNVLEGMEFILASGVVVIRVEGSAGEDRGAVVDGVATTGGDLDRAHA